MSISVSIPTVSFIVLRQWWLHVDFVEDGNVRPVSLWCCVVCGLTWCAFWFSSHVFLCCSHSVVMTFVACSVTSFSQIISAGSCSWICSDFRLDCVFVGLIVYTVPVECNGSGNLWSKPQNDGTIGLQLFLIPLMVSLIFLALCPWLDYALCFAQD
ncbi:hypothetical protein Bca4012_036403 [Brassica carinata]